jgi:hypothetical protein
MTLFARGARVFVLYQKHWHVYSRLDDTFSVIVL